MTQPRPHAETIIAWANGAQIQYRTKSPGTDWKDCDDPAFVADYEYRVKPAREYPETKLTENDMWCIYDEVRGPTIDALNAVANTALRHAIDAGQVVTREEFDRAIGDRNKRDIAVAEAVKAEMALRFGPMSLSAIGIACLDVEPILSKVKA